MKKIKQLLVKRCLPLFMTALMALPSTPVQIYAEESHEGHVHEEVVETELNGTETLGSELESVVVETEAPTVTPAPTEEPTAAPEATPVPTVTLEATPEATPAPTVTPEVSEAVAGVQETIDAILDYYLVEFGGLVLPSAEMTEEEREAFKVQIEDVVSKMDSDTIWMAQVEIADLSELIEDQLTEAEMEALVVENPFFMDYAEVVCAEEAGPNLMAVSTVVETAGGTVEIEANVGSFSVSGTTVTFTNSVSGFQISYEYNFTIYNRSDSKATFTYTNVSETFDTKTSNKSGTILGPNESVTLSAKTKCISGQSDKWVLSNILLTPYEGSANVSVSYDNTLGTVTTKKGTFASGTTDSVSAATGLMATANNGATFLGWVKVEDNSIVSTASIYVPEDGETVSVIAVFAEDGGSAWYKVDNKYLFNDLSAATAKGTTIVLMNNATLPAGNYEIPAGDTLLIPFDDSHTLNTSTPKCIEHTSGAATYVTPYKFRTLTMAIGANITVNGAINVNAAQYAGGTGSVTGGVCGPYGLIQMEEGSTITVNNGANLYVWGYITGVGSVVVEGGATVYENFQVMDWRGGSCVSTMATSERVFPMSQYYVQNIEVPMTLKAGAIENGYMSTTISYVGITGSAVPFIGPNGMFNITNGYVIKDYNESKDRLEITVYGDLSMKNLELSMQLAILGSTTLKSQNFQLPINNNISVWIKSGSINITQDIILLPGAEIIIEEGTNCTLGTAERTNNLYLFDRDQWIDRTATEPDWRDGANGLVGTGNGYKFQAIKYAPGRTGTRTEADLVDARIVVNGTVDLSNGRVYTTAPSSTDSDSSAQASGANICSEGGGKIIMYRDLGTSFEQSIPNDTTPEYYSVFATGAKLKNADGTYKITGLTEGTATKATYVYLDGVWVRSCNDGVAHSWTKDTGIKVADATCTEAQKNQAACANCEFISDTETVNSTGEGKEPLGHETELVSALEPTCYTDGHIEYYICNRNGCGKIFADEDANTELTQEAIVTDEYKKTGNHVYADATCTLPPTCTTEGCGATNGEALGHIYELPNLYGTQKEAANCINPAVHWDICDRCQEQSTEVTQNVGSALGHKYEDTEMYGDEAEVATCTSAAVHWDKCDVCQEQSTEVTQTVGTELGHDYTKDSETPVSENRTPTCTLSVTNKAACTRCTAVSDELLYVVSEALGHEFTVKSDDVAVEGTCYDKTLYKAKCSRCSEVSDDSANYIAGDYDHKNNIKTTTVANTCTESGKAITKCTVCGTVISSEDIEGMEPLGHSYVASFTWSEDFLSATATLTCTRKGCTDEVNGHTVTGTATVTEVDSTTGNCENASTTTYKATYTYEEKEYSEEKVVKGAYGAHDMTKTEAETPTCGEDGNIEYWTCSVCKKIFKDQVGNEVITEAETVDPATGNHTDAPDDGNHSCDVCEATGVTECEDSDTDTDHKCDDCDKDGITDHKWANASCAAPKTCSVCQETEGEKLAHTYGDVAFSWAGTTATATIECTACPEGTAGHVLSDSAEGTVSGSTAGDCKTKSTTTYTATITLNGVDYTDSKIVEGNYGLHNLTHVPMLEATCVTDGNIEYYSCEVEGCGQYFSEADGKNVLAEDTLTREALGHTYGNPVFTWEIDGSAATVTFTCSVCEDNTDGHSFIDSADVAVKSSSAGDCKTEGSTVYEASYTLEDKQYTDAKTVVGNLGAHPSFTVTDAKQETCVADGNIAYWTCTLCGKHFSDAEGNTEISDWIIPATGEHYDKEDDKDHKCEVCGKDNVTEHDWQDASCAAPKTCLICDVKEGDKLPHSYGEVEFIWAEDGKSANASITCANCAEGTDGHVLSSKATVNQTASTDGTCKTESTITYTATVVLNGNTYTETKTITGALGDHKLNKTEANAATCVAEGNNAYWTCEYCNLYFGDEFGNTTIEEGSWILPTEGHEYGAPEFSWADDGETAEVTITCEKCTAETENHTLQGSAVVEVMDSTEGNCQVESTITYQATITLNNKEYADTKVVKGAFGPHDLIFVPATEATCVVAGNKAYNDCQLCDKYFDEAGENEVEADSWIEPAKGHVYGEPTFQWAEETNTCKAIYSCTVCTEETVTKDCQMSSSSTDATCVTPGTVVFTASIQIGENIYTDTKTLTGVASGHDYKAEYNWSEDYTFAEIILTCVREEGCTEETTGHVVKSEVSAEEIAHDDGNCMSSSTTTYKVSYTYEGKIYADEKTVEGSLGKHSLEKTEAIEGNCGVAGNVAYWTCTICEKFFGDADGENTIEKDSWIIDATGEHTDAPADGDHLCDVCGQNDGSVCIDSDEDKDHKCDDCGADNVSEHELQEATCAAPQTCSVCGAVQGNKLAHSYGDASFVWMEDGSAATVTISCGNCSEDAEGHSLSRNANSSQIGYDAGNCQTESTTTYKVTVTLNGNEYTDSKTVVGTFGEHSLSKTDAVAETCGKAGNSAYWTCAICEQFFADAEGENPVEEDSWIIDATGEHKDSDKNHDCDVCGTENITEHEWQEATCAAPEICSVCGAEQGEKLPHIYGDAVFVWAADGKSANVSVICNECPNGTEGHVLSGNASVEVEEITAGDCETKSTTTYKATIVLGEKEYSSNKTIEGALGLHSLEKTEAKGATCAEDGNHAYWTCTICGKFYNDEQGSVAIAENSWVIKATGAHKDEAGDSNHDCDVCGVENITNCYDASDDGDHNCDECDKESITECFDSETDKDHKCDECGKDDMNDHIWKDATCVDPATCSICGTETGDKLPHVYGNAKFEWSEDGQNATAAVTCGNCPDGTEGHVLNGDAEIEVSASTSGDCQTNSTVTYKAFISLGGKEYTSTKTVEGALGTHSLEKTEAVEETCAEEGNSAYWTCSICNSFYADEQATLEVEENSWVLEATGAHKDKEADNDHACDVCGKTDITECYDSENDKDHNCDECDKADITEHEWMEATCTEPKTCTVCGTTEGEALGHSYVLTTEVAPTCEQAGYKEYTCEAGDDSFRTKNGNATGHDMAEATCTEPSKCKNGCGLTEGEALGHSFTTKVSAKQASEATCTAKASYFVQCDNCTVVSDEVTVEVGNLKSHSFHVKPSEELASEATCTKAATYYVQCDDCTAVDTKKTVSVGEMLPHSFTTKMSEQLASEATCTKAATYYVTCDNCAAVSEEITVAVGKALGHSYKTMPSDKLASAATCTKAATYFVQCDNCTEVSEEKTVAVGEVLPHSFTTKVSKKVASKATCTEPAVYYVQCDTCTAVSDDLTVAVGEALGHEMLPATCTLPSTCKNGCGLTEGEALGHDMAEATCSAPSTCKNGCGLTEGEKLSHTRVEVEETPALCDEPGHKAGEICGVCGVTLSGMQEIPAKGHVLLEVEAKKPTFGNPGWDAYERCVNCNYTTCVEIPALPIPSIETYDQFIESLIELEKLTAEYVQQNPAKDPLALMIKYIRTGVDRYNSGSWGIMAGYEDEDFAKFISEREDEINSQFDSAEEMIKVTALKDIQNFVLPNGDGVDFGHMFGTMDITYHNKTSVNHADVGGWAGDLVDLLSTADRHGVYTPDENGQYPSIEEMVADILANYLNHSIAGESDQFSHTDMYGDLDAFYIMQTVYGRGYENGTLTAIMQEYFTEGLTDEYRAEYFLENRLDGVSTRNAVRDAVYSEYVSNKVVSTLEGTRDFVTEDISQMRIACCYAFADYLCQLGGDYVEVPDNQYFTVFESSFSTLAPGITQEIKKATTADNKQIVYYIATADLVREDVNVYANYNENDPSLGWAMSRVQDQAQAAQDKYGVPESELYIENYNVITAINADGFNMSTGEPGGLLVMNGKEWHAIDGSGFFGILKDGTAVIGTQAEYNAMKDQVQEGVGGFGTTLIRDGEIVVSRNDNYYSDRASRTAVGITRSGKVVFMVLDGRQEPVSCGGSMQEIAQIMLEAGCVQAINLDGGGSSTYVAKPEGEDALRVVSSPSDGFARSVSTSLMMVSTAPSSTAFEHALVESEYDYLTVNSSVQMTAKGVSATGNEAEIPEGAYWAVDDAGKASITEDGVFTGLGLGIVNVNLMLGDEVLGSKTMNIVNPDTVYYTRETMNAVFGSAVELPVKALYQGKQVAINASDIVFTLSVSGAGTVEGFNFVANAESGLKNVKITATLACDSSKSAFITVSLFNQGEMSFDFEMATGGDRMLAWDRQVSNATTEDNSIYEVVDINEDMVTSYVFAIDMTQIPMPEKLEDLTYMLPGADAADASAWNFLLQLAERVSVLTEVSPTIKFDSNFDVDYSELKVVCEYFILNDVIFNEEENSLTLVLNWKDQSKAIDPETADSLCLLSGIKLTPKSDAAWDSKDRLVPVNTGEVSYNIFLRANALYTFASKPSNQEEYGLLPFENPDVIIGGATEKGGSFKDVYKTFEDTYTLINAVKNGWVGADGGYSYYKDGQMYTGIQEVDGFYYDFGTNGICIGQQKYNGLFEKDGKTHYAKFGALVKNAWISVGDERYCFDENGDGYHGTVEIDEVELNFENGKLVGGYTGFVEKADGNTYHYINGVMTLGWYQEGDDWYHFDTGTGVMNTGTHVLPDAEAKSKSAYYDFAPDGKLLKAYFNPAGYYYWAGLPKVDEWVQSGSVADDWPYNGATKDSWYRTNDHGHFVTGRDNPNVFEYEVDGVTHNAIVIAINNREYTFDNDYGYLLRGFFSYEEGNWYYYWVDEAVNDGWFQVDGKTYYAYEDGRLAVGSHVIDSEAYMFDSRGALMEDGLRLFVTMNVDGSVMTVATTETENLQSVRMAIWSDTNGQDDLVWINADLTISGEWIAEVPMCMFKDTGNYQIHAYAVDASGTDGLLVNTTTQVNTVAEHISGEAVVENVVEETCTVNGTYDSVVYCSACGVELTREEDEIPAKHKAGDPVVENLQDAICVYGGSYDLVVYCVRCGEELSREFIEVSGGNHQPGDAVIENKVGATCTTDGGYDSVISCLVCYEELSRKHVEIKAEGHIYSNDKDATCNVCGEKREVEEDPIIPDVPVVPGELEVEVGELPSIDTTSPVKDTVVGVDKESAATELEGNVNEVLTQIQDAIADKDDTVAEKLSDKISTEVTGTIVDALEKNSDINIRIYLKAETLKDAQLEAVKKDVEKLQENAPNAEFAQILDLNVKMDVYVDEQLESTGSMHELDEPIVFTAVLPEHVKQEIYDIPSDGEVILYVLYVHNGEVKRIDDVTINKDGSISFPAYQFSTYAIAYEHKIPEPERIETTPMYRLYNPNSGEHFYTGSVEERDMLDEAGWDYEGIAWNAPVYIGEPVYRVFNPNSGDHHYTMSQEEVDNLVEVGWEYEGVAWNSAPADHPEAVAQQRLYNPNADCGSHHYTSSQEELNMLVELGWIHEGIGWFGLLK